MRVDQIEAKTNPETRRAFLTRAALLGVAAVMTFGVAETEAAPITEAGDKPPGIPVDKEMTQGEKDLLAETVEPDDRVQGAYGYYGHYRPCTAGRTEGHGDTFVELTGGRIITERFGAAKELPQHHPHPRSP